MDFVSDIYDKIKSVGNNERVAFSNGMILFGLFGIVIVATNGYDVILLFASAVLCSIYVYYKLVTFKNADVDELL